MLPCCYDRHGLMAAVLCAVVRRAAQAQMDAKGGIIVALGQEVTAEVGSWAQINARLFFCSRLNAITAVPALV